MASSFHSMHQFHQTNQKDSLAPPSSLFHRPLFRCQPTLPTSSKSYRPSLCPLIKIICLPKNSSLNQTLNKPNNTTLHVLYDFSKPQKRTLFLPKTIYGNRERCSKTFYKDSIYCFLNRLSPNPKSFNFFSYSIFFSQGLLLFDSPTSFLFYHFSSLSLSLFCSSFVSLLFCSK